MRQRAKLLRQTVSRWEDDRGQYYLKRNLQENRHELRRVKNDVAVRIFTDGEKEALREAEAVIDDLRIREFRENMK